MGGEIMKLKYQKYLPKVIITHEMVEAFVENDFGTLHTILDLKPWEFSPLNVQTRKPHRDQTPEVYRGDPWRSSWWKAMALREKLQELAEQEGVKPSRHAYSA
jgi:hypothetical protein